MSEIEKEVEETLKQGSENAQLEDIPSEGNSPLNQAVKEKDIAGANTESQASAHENAFHEEEASKSHEPLDATEQEIGQEYSHQERETEEPDFELPHSGAEQAADALLGSANNLLAVGGGFFVRIRKHKEFYEFEEVIQVIETQNKKNVNHIKLDEEDLMLLRPILTAVIKKRARQLTPEEQLAAAGLTILVKKVQMMIQIRAENQILTDRILEMIGEEKAEKQEEIEPETVYSNGTAADQPQEDELVFEVHEEEAEEREYPMASVLEVADEKDTLNE